MMKNSISLFLPLALLLDLTIPFFLAPFYKGYSHSMQVMSVLGNNKSPLHFIYNLWLVLCGIILLMSGFKIYEIVSQKSKNIAVILFIVILIYAIGGCILSGIFSVGETKSLNTIPEKIHGYGAVIGFMCLTFAPLLISLYWFRIKEWCCIIKVDTLFSRILIYNHNQYENR
ncbi:DUF998 domain-containing protein, partial [Blautia producta]|uniref:DUF998 domain-containing protein n=1 Tax=Blautia producta TaxID=33035 RepID=UPI0035649C53